MTSQEEVLSQAEAAGRRGEWEKAASLVEDYGQTNIMSAKALESLAYYHSRARDYDSAIMIYKRLSDGEPGEAKWRNALGFQYRLKKQWHEAIAVYEEGVRLAPRWLLPALGLGESYQQVGQPEKALEAYRKGIQTFQELPVNRRRELVSLYAKLCGKAARILLSKPSQIPGELKEAIELFQESVTADPNDADTWYRLGCALLSGGRAEEALDCLQKAEILAPKKEYICHKIAQAYLTKGDPDQTLTAYARIPHHRRAPYILRGMARCDMAKGEPIEAARKLHQAIQREPGKFYHYWDLALALIDLGAKDQAIEALERTNHLYRQEHGKDYRKALMKLEDVRSTLPDGKRISFDVPRATASEVRSGIVIKYHAERGFGFIKDDSDGVNVFFHITRVKGRVPPIIGTRIRYTRELVEKGIQAAKAWLLPDG
jgi:tetratricopeptide (TPR) repeat protein